MAGSRRSSGTVKWFNPIKGFGFITPQDDSDEIFVHFTAIRSGGYRTLSDGQPVQFLVDYADDGRPMAVDVTSAARSPRPGGSRGGGGRGRGGRGDGYGYGRDLGFRQRVVGGDGYGNDNVECYNCGGIGHFARDCVPRSRGVDGRTSRRGGGRGGGGGGGGGRGCYNCGEEGHFARECPNAET